MPTGPVALKRRSSSLPSLVFFEDLGREKKPFKNPLKVHIMVQTFHTAVSKVTAVILFTHTVADFFHSWCAAFLWLLVAFEVFFFGMLAARLTLME